MGSTGSLAWPWQRADFETPFSAISMWLPQPLHVGLLHFRHVVLLHIFLPFPIYSVGYGRLLFQ